MSSFFAQVAQLEASGAAFALAVIVETKGSTPRHQAQMIVKTDGTIIGTVGGGMLERFVIKEALEAIRVGQSRLVSGNLSHHGTEALHMDCGGSAKILINVFGQSSQLVLIGGGHVNRAIAYLAHRLNFNIVVLDTYAPSLEEELFPQGTRCILGKKVATAIDALALGPDTYVIIATNHEDRAAISTLATQNIRYLGIMASRHKSQILLDMLRQNGVPEACIHAIRAPVGLDLGAETPEEIALSVMAEILSVKYQTSALPLYQMTALQKERLVVIRGAGEMATGVAVRLHRAGFRIVMLDILEPTSIRNTVAFSEAIRVGEATVEGVIAKRAHNRSEVVNILKTHHIAVMVDPSGEQILPLAPNVVIDAILAKKNLGTTINMATIVIGLGAGFVAGQDCHAIIETNRGHHLGRALYQGKAADDTGVPGNIMGFTHERLIRAPSTGALKTKARIGDLVKLGDVIAIVDAKPVLAPIDGMLRGLIHDGAKVSQGMKIGDVDPRGESIDPNAVSDKALAIAGGVLEAIFYLAKLGSIDFVRRCQ